MSEIHPVEIHPAAAASDPAVRSSRRNRRTLAAATVGSVVEAFDWSAYVVFTTFFTADLFGSDSRTATVVAYGGEGPTVAAYIAETAPRERRFLFSAISYGGVVAGSLLVFATVGVLDASIGTETLHHGGWRWGFAVGGVLGLLALWTGSEDFSRVIAEVPGALIALGAAPHDANLATAAMNHSPLAVFDESVLADGAALYAALALGRLQA